MLWARLRRLDYLAGDVALVPQPDPHCETLDRFAIFSLMGRKPPLEEVENARGFHVYSFCIH
jgi:hypothetical protein